MLGKTHVAFGALFWAGGAPIVGSAVGMDVTPAVMIGGLGITAIASVLPDIDHPNALITKGYIPGARSLGPIARLLSLVFSIPPRLVGMIARSAMGHRGGTHSILFMLLWTFGALPLYALCAGAGAWILSGALSWTPLGFDPGAVWAWEREHLPAFMPLVMLAVFLGYLSHLVSDSLNQAPVPWLWPMKKRIFFLPKPLRIQVSSPTEWLVRMVVILATVVIAFGTILAPSVRALMGDEAAPDTGALIAPDPHGPAGAEGPGAR